MFDLDTGVDFDEVVATHLVNQEFCCSSIPVSDTPGQLDGIGQYCLANLLGKVGSRSNLDDLLVATLNRAITFEKMDGVSSAVSEELNFDMAWTFEETFDEDCTITEGGLGFGNRTFKRTLELGSFTDYSHSTASTTHSSLDDNWGSSETNFRRPYAT
jgi:hypothetical protein